MGGKLSAVAKGRLMRLIDNSLESPVQLFLDELVNGTSMTDLGLNKNILSGQPQVDHVNDEVFGDAANPKAWWPSEEEKQDIVRGGFIQALEVALKHQPNPIPPIKSYWVVGAEAFEMIISDSPNQVNVFLLTPTPSKPLTPPPAGVMEDMWVVATDARCDDLFNKIPASYNPKPPEAIPSISGVKKLRLWGY